MLENEELIVLREKASTETLLDYVDYIKKEVIPTANSILNNKNAQISDLKSENASLKSEMATKEKAQTDSLLTKTEIDLRAVVNDMKDALDSVKNNNTDKSVDKIEKVAKRLEKQIDALANLNALDEVKSMIESINNKLDSNKEEIISKMNITSEYKQPEEIVNNYNNFEQDLNNEIESEQEIAPVDEFKAEVEEEPSFDDFNAFAPVEEENKVEDIAPAVDTPSFDAAFESAPIAPEVAPVTSLSEDIPSVPTFESEDTQEVVETKAEDEEPAVAAQEVTPVEETNAFDSILNNEVEEDVVKPSEDVLASIEETPAVEAINEGVEENIISEETAVPVEEAPVQEIAETEQEIKVTGVEPIPENLQQEMLKQANLDETPIEKLTAKLTKVKRSFVNKVKEDSLAVQAKGAEFIEMSKSMMDRFLQNIDPANLEAMAVTSVENLNTEEVKTR